MARAITHRLCPKELMLWILVVLMTYQYTAKVNPNLVVTAFLTSPPYQRHDSRRSFHRVGLISLSSDKNKNLSASARERREEEKRRNQRKDDVVPGKTSAVPNAQNYQLDPSATEQEYLRRASKVERQVHVETERGMEALKMFCLEQANNAFDKVFELKPNAYVWQAGIAKFYTQQIEQAEDIFRRSAEFYEERFGMVASEERIWEMACKLKLGKHETKNDADNEELMPETRKVHRIAGDLFSASLENDVSTVVLSRAKLRAICGDVSSSIDKKLWKLSSWYYLGLHYDALGQIEESKECIKAALRQCPSTGNGNDIIHTLPALHMTSRDWYSDDDDFVLDGLQEATATSANTDPFVMDSIRQSVAELKHLELQDALKTRGLKWHGSKQELQEKLFHSLIDDAGLDV